MLPGQGDEGRVRPGSVRILDGQQAVAAPAADDQADLLRIGDDDDRARLVEQLVGDRGFGNRLDVGQHADRVLRARILLGAGHRRAGQRECEGQYGRLGSAADNAETCGHGSTPELDARNWGLRQRRFRLVAAA